MNMLYIIFLQYSAGF